MGIAVSAHAFRTTLTHTVVGVTTATTQVLAANNNRNYLVLNNNNRLNEVFCKFGAAAVVNEGFILNPKTTASMIFDTAVPVAALNCIANASTSEVLVTEGIQPQP